MAIRIFLGGGSEIRIKSDMRSSASSGLCHEGRPGVRGRERGGGGLFGVFVLSVVPFWSVVSAIPVVDVIIKSLLAQHCTPNCLAAIATSS